MRAKQPATIITGAEWLEHRGSVGCPAAGSVLITDEAGTELPPGEQGEVWLRSVERTTPSYRYVGAEPRVRDGGWESLKFITWVADNLSADGNVIVRTWTNEGLDASDLLLEFELKCLDAAVRPEAFANALQTRWVEL